MYWSFMHWFKWKGIICIKIEREIKWCSGHWWMGGVKRRIATYYSWSIISHSINIISSKKPGINLLFSTHSVICIHFTDSLYVKNIIHLLRCHNIIQYYKGIRRKVCWQWYDMHSSVNIYRCEIGISTWWIQIMVCRLLCSKPLSKPMLEPI